MKTYNYPLLIIVYLICFCTSATSAAEESIGEKRNEILVIGSARIYEENLARARNEALQDAMLKGIESYFISLLGRTGMVSHFTRLVQEIIPQASGQIGNYHILSQERMGEVYKVFLSLKINEALMEQKLKEFNILTLKETPIKILFLVAETFTAGGEERHWWTDPEAGLELSPVELTLIRVFQDAGLHPLNRLIGLAEGSYDTGLMTPALTLDKALQWGRLFSADIIIQGRFSFRPEEVIEVDLKAINVHQAEFISHMHYVERPDDKEDQSPLPYKAIERAVRHVSHDLGRAIIDSMDKPKRQLAGLQVELSGLHNLRQQKFFLDFLRTQVRGIQSVVPWRIRNHSISFFIDYQGDASSFKRALSVGSGFPFPADIKIIKDGEIRIIVL